MSSSHKSLLTPVLIRSFLPISPFYTNFLVETKHFTNLEVSNSIAPVYFTSSFFTIFFCKPVLYSLGLCNSSVLVASIYFFNMILFLNVRKRSFFMAKAVYLFSGFVSTFDVILRFYIGETNTRVAHSDAKYSTIGLYRAVLSSLSSIVGQQIVNKTGHYEIAIHISIFTQFLSLILSSYDAAYTSTKKFGFADVNMFSSVLNMNSVMFCAFFAGSISDCFNLFTKLFIHNIFRDSNKVDQPVDDIPKKEIISTIRDLVMRVITAPISVVSNVLASIVIFIFPKYREPGLAQRKYLSGNADAVSNVLCYILTLLIAKNAPMDYKESMYISFLALSSIFLYLMTKTKQKTFLYLMYLCTGVFSKSCTSITKLFLKADGFGNDLIIPCHIFETILHSSINQTCRAFGINTISKTRIYAYIGMSVFVMILFIKTFSTFF